MKICRLFIVFAVAICVCIPACAKNSSRGVAVEGPKNKYEVKLEKTEKE